MKLTTKNFYNRSGLYQLLLSMPIYVSFNGALKPLSKYLIIQLASRIIQAKNSCHINTHLNFKAYLSIGQNSSIIAFITPKNKKTTK